MPSVAIYEVSTAVGASFGGLLGIETLGICCRRESYLSSSTSLSKMT